MRQKPTRSILIDLPSLEHSELAQLNALADIVYGEYTDAAEAVNALSEALTAAIPKQKRPTLTSMRRLFSEVASVAPLCNPSEEDFV